MTRAPVAAVLTLGCKLNVADSEEIAHGLRAAGFHVVDALCDADAYVVNTCSVTHVADRKARRLIRSVQRMAPEATVAVTGCYPQSAGEAAIRELGADLVTGTRDADKAELVRFLAERLPARQAAPIDTGTHRLHTRAFVKAQEGCNDVCAFCIVPRTRGREESRPPGAVAAQIRRAAEDGAREVVITGTQLGAWGRDLPLPLKPHHLISAVLDAVDIPRIRFSSLQPQDITPELLALWDDPRLMPHFHLALQSGSDTTLTRMRRRYGVGTFVAAAARIRAAVPDAAITTDVIAGFPGETEQDFTATLALCEEVGFARIHAFPYSQRERTAAARMEGQVPEPVRRERMNRLLALGELLGSRFHQAHRGTIRPVLWDGTREIDGLPHRSGLTDNYIRVFAEGTGMRNRITPVRLGDELAGGMQGLDPGGAP